MGNQLAGRPGAANQGITTLSGQSSATAPNSSLYRGFVTPQPQAQPISPVANPNVQQSLYKLPGVPTTLGTRGLGGAFGSVGRRAMYL